MRMNQHRRFAFAEDPPGEQVDDVMWRRCGHCECTHASSTAIGNVPKVNLRTDRAWKVVGLSSDAIAGHFHDARRGLAWAASASAPPGSRRPPTLSGWPRPQGDACAARAHHGWWGGNGQASDKIRSSVVHSHSACARGEDVSAVAIARLAASFRFVKPDHLNSFAHWYLDASGRIETSPVPVIHSARAFTSPGPGPSIFPRHS